MYEVVQNFLNESVENKKLFIKGIDDGNSIALDNLNKKFNDYLFRMYLISYIKKTIIYSSLKLRKGQRIIKLKEKLILNCTDEGFQEERINIICDKPVDYIEEINKHNTKIDFSDVIVNKKVLSAILKLTDRQRQILCMLFIQNKSEKEIANILHITVQSVNKTKNSAIKKLRKQLGGVL